MRFEFGTATRILFGPGVLQELGPLAKSWGARTLIVTGRNPSRAEPLITLLRRQSVEGIVYPITGEPTLEAVQAGAQRATAEHCDWVIGFGGGSALDASKAVAALMTNPGELLDYLEVVGRGQPLTRPAAPLVTIPTTAGTGAEVTRNAVLHATQHRVKASLRSSYLLPRLALIDSELTYSLPPAVTASTGLDTLTQLIEPFVTPRANPLTDGFCREGLRRSARSLRNAYEHGRDAAAREDLAIASLLSGLALANAGLGAVHGFAAPLGGMFAAPHGAVCAALLPHVMAANIQALRQRDPASQALPRYAEIARILTGNSQAEAEAGVQWVSQLCASLRIAPLSAFGVQPADFPALVEKAAVASSMKGNPVVFTDQSVG